MAKKVQPGLGRDRVRLEPDGQERSFTQRLKAAGSSAAPETPPVQHAPMLPWTPQAFDEVVKRFRPVPPKQKTWRGAFENTATYMPDRSYERVRELLAETARYAATHHRCFELAEPVIGAREVTVSLNRPSFETFSDFVAIKKQELQASKAAHVPAHPG